MDKNTIQLAEKEKKKKIKESEQVKLPRIKTQTLILTEDEDININQDAKNIQNSIEIFNPMLASRAVLKQCNVTREKSKNSQLLKKFCGHSIAMPDKSIGEIYSLFNY